MNVLSRIATSSSPNPNTQKFIEEYWVGSHALQLKMKYEDGAKSAQSALSIGVWGTCCAHRSRTVPMVEDPIQGFRQGI
jgi:hypothetical protein